MTRNGQITPQMIDIRGQTFGKWAVVRFVKTNERGVKLWLCKCECGNKKEIPLGNLRSGKSTQCQACATRELHTKHGMSETSIHRIWQNRIKSDCIKRWEDFMTFYMDVGDPPEDKKHLSKKNRSRPYGTSNFKWTEASPHRYGVIKWAGILAKWIGDDDCSEAEMVERLQGVSRARLYQLVEKAVIKKVIFDFDSVEDFLGVDKQYLRKHNVHGPVGSLKLP